MKGSQPLALALVVLAVIFAIAAVFFFTVKTTFLAGGAHPALHWKHAIVFTVLAVLSLIAANFARPKAVAR
jgi:hypothetical protein